MPNSTIDSLATTLSALMLNIRGYPDASLSKNQRVTRRRLEHSLAPYHKVSRHVPQATHICRACGSSDIALTPHSSPTDKPLNLGIMLRELFSKEEIGAMIEKNERLQVRSLQDAIDTAQQLHSELSQQPR